MIELYRFCFTLLAGLVIGAVLARLVLSALGVFR
jgi:hypothetical protein